MPPQRLKVSALAYLLKPVETEELRAALELVKERKESNANGKVTGYLLENIKKMKWINSTRY